jgi:hypothetical protein
MALRVSYKDFWVGFDPSTSLLTKLLEEVYAEKVLIVHDHNVNVDVEFRSVFTFNSKVQKLLAYGAGQLNSRAWTDYLNRSQYGFSGIQKHRGKKTVWFTGENLRAPGGVFDLTLSFDPTDLSESNIYFPVWYLSVDWFKSHSTSGLKLYDVDTFISNRNLDSRERTACAFSSSKEPSRVSLYHSVECAMKLDRYGSAWGNRVQNKNEVAMQYGFQVCPENDIYPGYVTEKLFEAYAAGNVPIWRGIDRDGLFNKSSILDLTGISASESINILKGLSDNEITSIRNQPLLNSVPSIQPIVDAMRAVLLE